MNKVISTIKGFGKARYVILAVGALAFIAIGVSSGAQPAKSDTCTQIAVPQTPAFNVWPLTYDNSVPCADLPMIDAADASATGRNARFSQSQAEHDAGIQANPGDYVTISVYFHNGATPDPSLVSQTTAQNVQVSTSYNAGASTAHTFSASISTSNGAGASSSDPARGGNITVNTSVPTTVVYVPGSTSMSGGSGNRSLPDGIANGSIGLGSIMACWNYSGTIQYQVQIVAVATTPTCTVSNSPAVNGQQGYDASTNAYTTQVYPNNYLILYGTGFGSNPTVSNLPAGASESAGISSQINILLGSYTGPYSITVTNGSGCTGTATGTIVAATVTPPPVTPAGTISANPNPIQVCTGTLGTTTITSSANVDYNIYVGLPGTTSPTQSGVQLFTSHSANSGTNTDVTGNWVQNGEIFFLVQKSNGTLLGQVTVSVTSAGCSTPPPTCTVSNSPAVNGQQGYDASTNAYTTQVYPNNYLILYGTGFGSNPTVSNLPAGASESAGISSQINILLGSYTGPYSITVTNGSGCTGTATGTIAAAAVTPPPVTVTPAGTISANPNPIQVCTGSTGSTYISSSANVPYDIYTVVPSNNGSNLLATHPGDGVTRVDQTNGYVGNGTVFYLVDTANGAVLAQVTVDVTSAGCTVTPTPTPTPPPGYAQLQINKLVQDQNYATPYSKSVNAYPNDLVKFQITVQNIGTAAAANTYVTDPIPAGLSYLGGTTTVNGTAANDITAGNLSLGTLQPNQTDTIVFSTTVQSTGTNGNTIQNTATASASNAYSVQSSASVFVQTTGTVSITQSKSAYNNTLGVNATTQAAQPGNTITYTLRVSNTGSAQATGYTVSDDLSNVLQFASLVSANGGSLNGSVISWPSTSIAPGSSTTDTFVVQVNSNTNFNGSQQMVNTFGNTVVIPLVGVQPVYVQPQPVQPIYVQQQQQQIYIQPQQSQTQTVYVQPQPQQVYVQPQQPLLQVQPPVQQPQVLGATFVAPKTGADADTAYAFAGLITTATAAIRKRTWLTKLFKK